MLSKTFISIVYGILCLACATMAFAEKSLSITSELRPLEVFQDCEACPEMITLPMGSFIMGGPPGESQLTVHWDVGNIRPVTPDDPYIAEQEGPLHSVTIDLSIAMGRNEVTIGEWKACVAEGRVTLRGCREIS